MQVTEIGARFFWLRSELLILTLRQLLVFKKEGTHLIKSLVVPMRVHELELRRHPIVLPHPQGVHDSELKLLITANVS